MKLGIMQPYFFPYLGYFDLIHRTDRWVVFDVVKYTPRTWMNRNRILHPDDGWQYITVPVSHGAGDGSIKDTAVLDMGAAHRRILGQLQHYRTGRAPFFAAVRDLVDQCFVGVKAGLLRDINVRGLALVCGYLGIKFDAANLSEMSISLPDIHHPGQWALEISSALGASEYLNPPGGRDLFNTADFEARGIRLGFADLVDFKYATAAYGFIDHLSIIDVMMWSPPERIKQYLDSRR